MPPENSDVISIKFYSRINLIISIRPYVRVNNCNCCFVWTAMQMEVHSCVKFRTNSGLRRKFKPKCMLSAFNVDISVDVQSVAGDGGHKARCILEIISVSSCKFIVWIKLGWALPLLLRFVLTSTYNMAVRSLRLES